MKQLNTLLPLTYKFSLALLIAISISSVWATLPAQAQGPCFVETTGDNSTDFDSVDATALQLAVLAASSGDTIKVAGSCAGVQMTGGLTQTVFISQSLTIQGGYTHTNWLATSAPDTHTTTLDALRGGRVSYITGTVDVTFDGLYLTGGDGGQSGGTQSASWRNFGGAAFLESGNTIIIANSTIYSNTVIGANNKGGAIGLEGTATAVITNSIVRENVSPTNQGGAIYTDDETNSLMIYNSRFINNYSGSNQGGAIYNDGLIAIYDSMFEDNYSGSNQGGVLYADSSSQSITITNSVFRNNWSGSNQGGALYLRGPATIISSTFEGNYSGSNQGGAIYNLNTSLPTTITHSIFRNNWSGTNQGGALYLRGPATVISSMFEGNYSGSNDGGAIYSGGTLHISQSHFEDNYAADDAETNNGGAIHNSGDNLTIATTTFISNSATGNGGAIYHNGDHLMISNTTIISNNSKQNGGGIANTSSEGATIQNVTLSANSAVISGGGLYNSGVLTYQNTIIANSGSGGDCVNDGGTINSNVNNLVEDGSCSATLMGDSLLSPLGNYGGDTQTLALLPGSPAINAGDTATCTTTDQRGQSRVGTCDIGAFESQGFYLMISGGNHQRTITQTAFAEPLQVTYVGTDTNLTAGAGYVIDLAAPSSGASLSTTSLSGTTDSSGVASVAVTANAIEGSYLVTATTSLVNGSVVFNLENGPFELYLPVVMKN